MKRIRVCPCGARLERKSYESAAKFEERKYCNCQCKGKYHRDTPKEQGFGLQVPKDKSRIRVGPGLQSYIDDRPLYDFIA